MTLTVETPAQLDPLPPMDGRPTDVQAAAGDLRQAAHRLRGVVEDSTAAGLPAGWEGRASEAAGSAASDFATESDAVVAALLEGVLAVERYGDRLATLDRRWDELVDQRDALNAAVRELRARVDGAPEDEVPRLRGEAGALQQRVDGWIERAETWQRSVTDAETQVGRALREVDAVSEGREAAGAADRPDVDALATRLAAIDDPQAVNDWWRSLSPAEQEALTTLEPGLVGGTDGVPAASRDDANRLSMANEIDRLSAIPESERTEAEQRLLDNALEAEQALEQGADEIDFSTGQPLERMLMLYRPDAAGGDGFAALAFGNPDTADHTSVSVPGITNDGSTLGSNAEDALALWRSASSDGSSVSTMMWIGYDAPSATGLDPDEIADMANVVRQEQAEAAGADLADFVAGLRASHEGEPADMTVIGHSYGSSTVAQGLAAGMGDDVDQAALLGSPGAGIGVDSADDLVGPDGELYVGSRDRDPVTWLGNEEGYDVVGDGLDALGRGLEGLPGVPDLPGSGLPDPGDLPGVPDLGDVPDVPGLPGLPDLPGMDGPDMPDLPDGPGLSDLPFMDQVPYNGDPFGLGTDPAHEDFGATRIDVGDGESNPLSYLDNHTTYYEGEGLDHLGDIVADRDLEDGAVIPGRDQDGLELAQDAGRDAGADALDFGIDAAGAGAGALWDGVSDGANEVVDGAGRVLDDVGGLLPSPESFSGVFG